MDAQPLRRATLDLTVTDQESGQPVSQAQIAAQVEAAGKKYQVHITGLADGPRTFQGFATRRQAERGAETFLGSHHLDWQPIPPPSYEEIADLVASGALPPPPNPSDPTIFYSPDLPSCKECGMIMRKHGSGYRCNNCGSEAGYS